MATTMKAAAKPVKRPTVAKPTGKPPTKPKSAAAERPRMQKGFAVMSPKKQLEIARMGGKTISRDRAHMAAIGAIGGVRSGKSRWGKARF